MQRHTWLNNTSSRVAEHKVPAVQLSDNKVHATQRLSHAQLVRHVQIMLFTCERFVVFLLQNYDDVPRLSSRLYHHINSQLLTTNQ